MILLYRSRQRNLAWFQFGICGIHTRIQWHRQKQWWWKKWQGGAFIRAAVVFEVVERLCSWNKSHESLFLCLQQTKGENITIGTIYCPSDIFNEDNLLWQLMRDYIIGHCTLRSSATCSFLIGALSFHKVCCILLEVLLKLWLSSQYIYKYHLLIILILQSWWVMFQTISHYNVWWPFTFYDFAQLPMLE